jgi:hypothetical protein
MLTMRSGLILGMLLAACQQPQARPVPKPKTAQEDTRERALQVHYDFTPVGKPVEGEFGLVRMKLRNVSKTYCLFIKSVIDLESGLAIHWQRSRGGEVHHDPKEDEYLHDRTAYDPLLKEPEETPAVFNHGFLAPSIVFEGKEYFEDLDVNMHVRLIRLPRPLRIEYFALTREEVLHNVYFHMPKPVKPNEKAPTIDRYVRPTPAYLEELIKYRHVNVAQAMLHKEDVIYPNVVYAPVTPARVMVGMNVERRAFSVDHAVAKAGLTDADIKTYSYSSLYRAWLLQQRNDKVMMVDETSADVIGRADLSIFDTQDMPNADGQKPALVELVFVDADSVVPFMTHEKYKPDRSKLKEGQVVGRIYTAETRSGRRVFLNLKADAFREFLRECGNYNLVLKRGSGGRIAVMAQEPKR